MKKHLLAFFRWYFSRFFIRKGKIPMLNLISKFGLTKNESLTATFDEDILISLDLDDWIQKQIYFFGLYEIERTETLYWQQKVKGARVVFDIGANIGYYSLMAAKRLEQGIIYAFEPSRQIYTKLERNIRMNGFDNIKAFNLAVSDQAGAMELYAGNRSNTGTTSFIRPSDFSGEAEQVRAITLDEFIEERNITVADIIKIDVEGAEMKALKGMQQTLHRLNPTVLIEVLRQTLEPAGSSMEEVYAFLNNLGYKPYAIDKKLNLIPLNKPSEGSLIVFKKGS